jgi:UDP-2,4-diacetamido-2,4,6-trideoxy-beta-L-altropyranose hydrolase
MTVAGTLLVRADAGPNMGTGHLMRSLALAQAWQAAGGRAAMVTCCGVEALRNRIRAAGAGLVCLEHPHPDPADLAATLALLAETKSQDAPAASTWLVLDGYHFDPAYQQAVRDAGGRVLVIDDLAQLPHYHADVLLNQNLGADRLDYPCDAGTLLLLGCRYALLRPEFRRWRSFRRETSKHASKLLVTLGGADPENLTGTVVAALGQLDLPYLEVKILVGAANPHLENLRKQAGHCGRRMEILTGVADVAEWMAWADLAVSAAGSTCWEMAFMQLPAVLLVLANNQEPVAQQVAAAGAATSLGRADRLTPEAIARELAALCRNRKRRASQSGAGLRLVDGLGAERVVAVIEALEGTLPADQLAIRPASAEDALPLWHLVNDPAVRRAALASSEPIPLESHVRWFKRRLASPGSCIWVLDLQGLVLAQVRYDRTGSQTAEISVSVTPAFRRRGLATRLLELTGPRACQRLGISRLRAIIWEENLPSARTFAKLGFTKVDSRLVENHPCHIYEHHQAPTVGRGLISSRHDRKVY